MRRPRQNLLCGRVRVGRLYLLSDGQERAARARQAIRTHMKMEYTVQRDTALKDLGEVNFHVPLHDYGVVEITHLTILHAMVDP